MDFSDAYFDGILIKYHITWYTLTCTVHYYVFTYTVCIFKSKELIGKDFLHIKLEYLHQVDKQKSCEGRSVKPHPPHPTPPRGGWGVSQPIRLGTDVYSWYFQNTSPFIYSIFLKPYPFIYFHWKSWPNHIFHHNIVTCLYIVAACANSVHCCCYISNHN
jgi:hypothetical protein